MNAWSRVTAEFNRHCKSRSLDSLKTCWANLKKGTRSCLATERTKDKQTGGGENDFEKNPMFEEMLKVVGHQMEPLPDVDLPEKLLKRHDTEEVYKYLVNTGQLGDWSRWGPTKMKKLISAPLDERRKQIDILTREDEILVDLRDNDEEEVSVLELGDSADEIMETEDDLLLTRETSMESSRKSRERRPRTEQRFRVPLKNWADEANDALHRNTKKHLKNERREVQLEILKAKLEKRKLKNKAIAIKTELLSVKLEQSLMSLRAMKENVPLDDNYSKEIN